MALARDFIGNGDAVHLETKRAPEIIVMAGLLTRPSSAMPAPWPVASFTNRGKRPDF